MDKILLVLFLIFLSSCGRSDIENCADDKFSSYTSEPSIVYPNCYKYLPGGELTTQMIFDESFGRVKFSKKFYKCARDEQENEKEHFISQSLRKKISNQLYETYYIRCKSIYE